MMRHGRFASAALLLLLATLVAPTRTMAADNSAASDATSAGRYALPFCATATSMDCVESVGIVDGSGVYVPAVHRLDSLSVESSDSLGNRIVDGSSSWSATVQGINKQITIAASLSTPNFLVRHALDGSDVRYGELNTNVSIAADDGSARVRFTLRTSWLVPLSVEMHAKDANYREEPLVAGTRWLFDGAAASSSIYASDWTAKAAANAPGDLDARFFSFRVLHANAGGVGSGYFAECTDAGYIAESTDAATYGSGNWNAGTHSLDFSVFAPPTSSTGKPMTGFFTARIPEAYAACMWPQSSFTNPTSIAVQLVRVDGSIQDVPNAAVRDEGVIRVSVAGFAYSQLTVRVVPIGGSMSAAWATSQFLTPKASAKGMWGVNLVEDFSEGSGVSYLTYGPSRITKAGDDRQLCSELGVLPCAPSESTDVQARLTLAPCQEIDSSACIESVRIATAQQPSTSAKLLGSVPQSKTAANNNLSLPAGGSPSKWSTGSETSGFLVSVLLSGTWRFGEPRFSLGDLRVQVTPYAASPGNYGTRTVVDSINPDTGLHRILGHVPSGNCIWFEPKTCGVPQEFADGTSVSVTLRIPSELNGWLRGRLKLPQVEVSTVSSGINRLTVTAEPVDVPIFYGEVPIATMSDQIRALTSEVLAPDSQITVSSEVGSSWATRYIDAFRDIVHDTAAGHRKVWSFQSVSTGLGSKCLSDSSRLLGLVTTNSMNYEGSAPSFDGSALTYKVSGMHYTADGQVQTGTYDLAIRSDTARCLYGFSDAPLSASVSLVYADGETRVAAESIRESGGWLYLSASGFTFSNPTIKVVLSKAGASPSATPTALPQPSASARPTPTPTPSDKPIPSATPSPTSSATMTPTASATTTPDATPTPSVTPSPSVTSSATSTPTPSVTPTPTATPSVTPKPTVTKAPVKKMTITCVNTKTKATKKVSAVNPKCPIGWKKKS